ncbi:MULTISPECIES: undecaprenyl-phosphate glucose phosphotransferase [Pseudomonas]|uniref:Capsular polysaccharide biosynthesis protein n=4 Tax=Pseudomonas syringae group genomosp. 2 TaxID=251698 RepID=A0A3M3AFI9_PSESS|nr:MULTISPECIES: undecaprenyl-phosphate glucose phosphotransferase [Pseudomonas]ARD11936.1 undecaprenyl-phosphate glucose phosphotransferase [Pseudomonas savastanoi pv. savastanoi NCPPB 3335]KAA3545848.1 undecaprenyl-phosphate glucose phosphotransferase [Pseudomonas savastanoi]KPB22763.1 Undecaprenyl-phosphate galactosephosphotransferase [Pseudomonas savastanoi]KPX54205.1 Capsular polysaccharide biosynthesis protein [Pseudomonas amygdali pv. photiniae]KPX97852.1 Capsular polysaccharide biosynt
MRTSVRGILHAHQSALSLAHRLLDLIIIVLIGYWQTGLQVSDSIEAWSHIILAVLVFHWVSEYHQLYGSWRGERILRELTKVFSYWAMTFITLLSLNSLLLNQTQLPDNGQMSWFALALAVLCGYRLLIRLALHRLRRHGFNTRRVAIVGTGQVGERLARSISLAPWMGLNLLGFYDSHPQQMNLLAEKRRLPVLGDLDQLIEDARASRIDKVYITLAFSAEPQLRELITGLSDTTASVYLIPDVFMFDLLHARSESINGLASISIFDSPMDGAWSLVKRAEDIVLSSLILLLIALPLLAIAAAIKLTSAGPVLFRQRRYGLDGRSIMVWKFRSMNVQENADVVLQATRNDARVTPLGAFLRRTSLDELPQFFNVLHGDMSIVGPRPHAIAHNEQYRKQVSGYMLRHKVKPGITGWAQINGWRGETDTLDKMRMRVEFDLEYIEHWSIWLDLKIILLTLFKGFVNKNAF